MIPTMNDYDYEEHLLLQSLDNHRYHPQPLNLDNNNYHRRHFNCQSYHRTGNQYSHSDSYRFPQHHTHHWNENQSASTVSMTTEEERLDELDIFDGESSEFSDAHTDQSVVAFSTENTTDRDTARKPSRSKTKPRTSFEESEAIRMDDRTTLTSDPNDDDNVGIFGRTIPEFIVPEEQNQPTAKTKKSKTANRSARYNAESNEPLRVDNPSRNDILCGQSRLCANHAGNRYFQHVVENFAPRYSVATTKQEKMAMTKEIVAIIHSSGGHFLKFKDGMWEEISIVAARDKVSHALRTKVASWTNKLKGRDSPSRRRGSGGRSSQERRRKGARRSSSSSVPMVSPRALDTISSDPNDSVPSHLRAMLESQRQFFASLTTPERDRMNARGNMEGVDNLMDPIRLSNATHSRRWSSEF